MWCVFRSIPQQLSVSWTLSSFYTWHPSWTFLSRFFFVIIPWHEISTCCLLVWSMGVFGFVFYPCPSVRVYQNLFLFCNFNLLKPNFMKLMHNANYHKTQITIEFLWHHFYRSIVMPLYKWKNCLNICFLFLTIVCLNKKLWTYKQCLLPQNSDQVHILVASLLQFLSYVPL